MTGSVTRKFSALAATGCLLALTACDSETDATPGGPESPSASNSAAPTPGPTGPTPPTMPPEAQGTSTASAKAFVRHYIDQVNFATATGDTTALGTLSGRACKSCTAVINRIDEVYSAGGKIESRGWIIRSMRLVPLQPHRSPILDVGLLLSRQVVTSAADARPQRFPGGKLPMTFYLTQSDGEWRVIRWDRAA